ncbi:hypothetical protein SAMN02799636_06037 [Methylobacterium sp. 275MFSha3.1]|uniref:hypothetical protein n=1 Tax=Methylobacterium sp. 275MFSha3.1 TaxID=1502746 RepID=UPI0008A74E9A|nr:hypothetical protein [Methylobacterium sp. 275MFSha3.1]SEI15161.1 hypothetical protein SAMN02799636_06037 [Methylobacterium sp. 275MFSha3.1]
MPVRTAAVIYLARGFEADHTERFRRFVESYRAHSAGHEHKLYIIFKGFATAMHRAAAEEAFDGLDFKAIDTDDLSFDLGAYADALRVVSDDHVCFLNTNSEISAPFWLAKLLRNLDSPGVGMVGATGSFESLRYINGLFPEFPNPHLRTNAFAMRREHARELLGSYAIRTKLDAFFAESGADGLTRRILARGLTCLVVGGDGRGYALPLWPSSETSRQGTQGNLLVHDNYTRAFEQMGAQEREEVTFASWGRAIPATVTEAHTYRFD